MAHKSNQKERDVRLKSSIESALSREKDFSGYDINVRVVNGKITLQGIVDTFTEKKHAHRVAASVEGVSEVENNLTISTDGAVDDRHVYMEVRQELEEDPLLRDIIFKVQVKKGVVTLRGEVESMAIKEAALEAAGKAMGVKEVINNLKVSKAYDMDDADIVNAIRRAFASQGINGDRIEVGCRRGVVSLKGSVGVEARNQVMALVTRVPGVKRVQVHLMDTSKEHLKDAARAAVEIKKSFALDKDLKDLSIDIYEEDGHLVLGGLLADAEEKRLVDRKLHSLLEEFGRDLTAVENKIRLPD